MRTAGSACRMPSIERKRAADHERAFGSKPRQHRTSHPPLSIRGGLGRHDWRAGRLLVLPAMAGGTCLQLRSTGRPDGDVEDRVAALPADRGVDEVHATAVSGLLCLVRYATEAVFEGPADRSRCP